MFLRKTCIYLSQHGVITQKSTVILTIVRISKTHECQDCCCRKLSWQINKEQGGEGSDRKVSLLVWQETFAPLRQFDHLVIPYAYSCPPKLRK
jgi:hypothetical protein